MVTSSELRSGGALIGDVLGEGVRSVREVHHAVSTRVFDALPPTAAPVRQVHDAIAATAYGASRFAHLAIPRLGGALAAPFISPAGTSITDAPAGRVAVGAVNGLWGDRVERSYAGLAVPMTLRVDGAAVDLSKAGVRRAWPRAGGRLAVFVHGLCETEAGWGLAARRRHGEPGVTYGSLLERDLGLTPVFVRYNTGACLTDSSAALAELLQRLVALWPTPVDEIVLVGHSMGGLVARGACQAGAVAGHDWPEGVRHVFCLGSPHLGARLERGVEGAARLLRQVPETRPAARWLASRSAGVKDLRHGVCLAAEDRDHDAATFVRHRASSPPRWPATPTTRRPAWSATCSCTCPAPRVTARTATSGSRPRTASTWAG
jgi:pimeloyl-ACP methyl ester carboxylesterase